MNWLRKLLQVDELKEEIKQATVSNDHEIVALKLEIEKLERELSAKNITINDISMKNIDLEEVLKNKKDRIVYYKYVADDMNKLANELKEQNNKLKSSNNAKDVKRYKQYCREKDVKIAELTDLYENNKNLREAYEFIDDKKNKKELMKNLGYNFKRYVDENNINITTLAEELELSRETLKRIYESTRGTSVTTFKLIEYDMCKYLNCNSLDLVKRKASEYNA